MAQIFSEKKITAISRLGIWEHFKKRITDETQYLLAQKGDHVVKDKVFEKFAWTFKRIFKYFGGSTHLPLFPARCY